MKLLAVDDDPVIRELLPVIFKEAGLPDMELAASGEEALGKLSDPGNYFDCLLFDIQMEKMDGVELCQQTRKLLHHRHTPVIMLTSVVDHAKIESAFAAGANDYINKPFDVKEIATRVRVAQRMIEQAGPVTTLDARISDDEARPGIHNFTMEEPLRLASADQIILPFSLGNYLSQLSRRRLDACSIFATKVEEIGNLYASSKSHEFARALTAIADVTVRVVDTPSLLMSYCGDGMFLSITQDSDLPEWPLIEDQMNAELVADGITFDDGGAMPLGLSVGNPVSPNASRTQRVKKTFDRAIDRALMREKTKIKNAARPPMAMHTSTQGYHIN